MPARGARSCVRFRTCGPYCIKGCWATKHCTPKPCEDIDCTQQRFLLCASPTVLLSFALSATEAPIGVPSPNSFPPHRPSLARQDYDFSKLPADALQRLEAFGVSRVGIPCCKRAAQYVCCGLWMYAVLLVSSCRTGICSAFIGFQSSSSALRMKACLNQLEHNTDSV